mgnify:CR=1 FL=1
MVKQGNYLQKSLLTTDQLNKLTVSSKPRSDDEDSDDQDDEEFLRQTVQLGDTPVQQQLRAQIKPTPVVAQ